MISEEVPETYQLLIGMINKIMDSISNDDNITMMNETMLLIETLPEEIRTQKKTIQLEKNLNQFLTNPENMRILRLNNTIKKDEEANIEYYDRDLGNDEKLHYNTKLEKDLLIIQQQTRSFLANIIKNQLSEPEMKI